VGYGVAAGVFTGTTWLPVAYAGAFAWGVAGAVFATVAVTMLQRLAPVRAHGRVMGVAATIQSAAGTAGLPLAGTALSAFGIRAGAAALAAVAIAAGASGGTAANGGIAAGASGGTGATAPPPAGPPERHPAPPAGPPPR
jgi:hypothetical protein